MLFFAHRGCHEHPNEENTLAAFLWAIHAVDGFECDVRLSRDGVPVVIHDATLVRTHGVDRRVDDMIAMELKQLNVPTLEEVLGLLSTRYAEKKSVILDLKVAEQTLLHKTTSIARRQGVRISSITFIVWNRMKSAPPPHARVLRAVDYTFRTHHPFVDGVACKYDGSEGNRRCIERALEEGLDVNLWSPDPRNLDDMVSRYGQRCVSLTV